jgi:hypothetical protein
MHASLYNRSSHPILKSAPRCTVSLTMLSLLPVLSKGSCLSPHRTLPPISVTSRLSSHKQISLGCDRRVTLMKRSRRLCPGNSEPPAPSGSSATSSLAQQEREFHKAVQPGSSISLYCSARRVSRSWLGLPVVPPFAVSQRRCASCGLQRRRLRGHPQISIKLGAECKALSERLFYEHAPSSPCFYGEPEARFFMIQLIGACHYMHTYQVIHRDLKPSNVGDFGLQLPRLSRVLANGRRPSVERRTILRQRYCLAWQTDTASTPSRLTPGPLVLSYTLLSLAVCLPSVRVVFSVAALCGALYS